jgi:HEAT repeat protein
MSSNINEKEIFALLKSEIAPRQVVGLILVGKTSLYKAVPHVVRHLTSENDDVRTMAAWALDQLASPMTVPALLNALRDPVFSVQSNAAWALVSIATATVPQVVVPDVVEILREETDEPAGQMAFLVLYHIDDDYAREAIALYWDNR